MSDQNEVGTPSRCRLYLISPPSISDLSQFTAQVTDALSGGDVACFQLRLKGCDDPTIIEAARMLKPVVQQAGTAFLINDRPDIAAQIDADGVHVGQEDTPYTEAREILGPDAIIGVTAHDSRHLAMEAGEAGADYVAFGAFFPTTTKEPKSSADVSLITWWTELFEVPCVAIGGITTAKCGPLVEAGADFLAVSAGVWQHGDGPAAAVSQFNAIFENTK